ncbi:MAG: DUF3464 family protein [Acaryochloridaceae cyanobacterium RL_2_7]|nr:DUF3464 family protein [Acaryochloridaceae cyanobacterium RL_2_7]
MAESKSSQKQEKEGQGSDRLPFEPKGSKKSAKTAKSPSLPKNKKSNKARSSREGGIPDVVSKRMAKRMAIFCGVPTLMGLATLPTSYFLITNDIVDLPNTAVLLFSLLCLGLSVLGLSYGVISASWDEGNPGTLLGIEEFQLNLSRLVENWKDRS